MSEPYDSQVFVGAALLRFYASALDAATGAFDYEGPITDEEAWLALRDVCKYPEALWPKPVSRSQSIRNLAEVLYQLRMTDAGYDVPGIELARSDARLCAIVRAARNMRWSNTAVSDDDLEVFCVDAMPGEGGAHATLKGHGWERLLSETLKMRGEDEAPRGGMTLRDLIEAARPHRPRRPEPDPLEDLERLGAALEDLA